jgi:hypothetical protein
MGEKQLDQSERKHFHMNFHWNALKLDRVQKMIIFDLLIDKRDIISIT